MSKNVNSRKTRLNSFDRRILTIYSSILENKKKEKENSHKGNRLA